VVTAVGSAVPDAVVVGVGCWVLGSAAVVDGAAVVSAVAVSAAVVVSTGAAVVVSGVVAVVVDGAVVVVVGAAAVSPAASVELAVVGSVVVVGVAVGSVPVGVVLLADDTSATSRAALDDAVGCVAMNCAITDAAGLAVPSSRYTPKVFSGSVVSAELRSSRV
jgi:hypothetical protein